MVSAQKILVQISMHQSLGVLQSPRYTEDELGPDKFRLGFLATRCEMVIFFVEKMSRNHVKEGNGPFGTRGRFFPFPNENNDGTSREVKKSSSEETWSSQAAEVHGSFGGKADATFFLGQTSPVQRLYEKCGRRKEMFFFFFSDFLFRSRKCTP